MGRDWNKTFFVSHTDHASLHTLTPACMKPALRQSAVTDDSLCEHMCSCAAYMCDRMHARAGMCIPPRLRVSEVSPCGNAAPLQTPTSAQNQNNVSQIKIRSTAPIALSPSHSVSLYGLLHSFTPPPPPPPFTPAQSLRILTHSSL